MSSSQRESPAMMLRSELQRQWFGCFGGRRISAHLELSSEAIVQGLDVGPAEGPRDVPGDPWRLETREEERRLGRSGVVHWDKEEERGRNSPMMRWCSNGAKGKEQGGMGWGFKV